MASHLKKAVELTKTSPGVDRGGSRPKPPKAVAGSASLEAPRPTPDHEKAKRCLTAKTVAGPPAKGSGPWRGSKGQSPLVGSRATPRTAQVQAIAMAGLIARSWYQVER
jgi:hypothetical protein